MNRLAAILSEDAERICRRLDLSPLLGKTVLVTGASGLVGGYILACLKHLAQRNPGAFELLALMQSPPPAHLLHSLDYPEARVLRGDLTDPDFLRALPQVDCLIHAAGYGQPGRFMEDPVKTIHLNTATTLALFQHLSPDGRFLFLSTSEVYSGLTVLPNEGMIGTTNTTHPRACYIEAKRCGEAICNAFRGRGIKAHSARLALAYGPGTRKGDRRVINSFIEKALQGRIDLLDQGEAKRTYCYVSDAVEILWRILLDGTEPIYNVGGRSQTTIRELAQTIGRILDVPVSFPEQSQHLSGAPAEVRLDLSRVASEFGKVDFVPLEEGLRRTIEWQQSLYASE